MDLILKRTEFLESGIFGHLYDLDGNLIASTLEHAYDAGNGDGSYAPKLPAGEYTCLRGQHQLSHMRQSFITFEVLNVPGHTGILFHVGNFNDDSNGCILLGSSTNESAHYIEQSQLAFNKFMRLQEDINEFKLTVKNGDV